MQRLASYYKSLRPRQKKVAVMLGLGLAMTVIGVMAYVSSSNEKTNRTAAVRTKNTVLSMDNNLLDKSQLLEAQKKAQMAEDELANLRKSEEDQKKAEAAGLLPPPGGAGMFPVVGQGGAQKRSTQLPPVPQQGGFALPPPPPPPSPSAQHGPSGPGVPPPPQQPAMVESEVGGIAVVAGVENKSTKDGKEGKKKEDKRSVFLPISYMEATLLSGLDAPTSNSAKGNPVPVLIRVKTPAVLPNDVKANLRGCFVVADGKGNLATERAELITVSLSCIDRKGQAVIDQPITGYVVDADGKAGLRGRVVTKMGAMITRSMIAGLFGGFGEALNEANTTTSLSAIGSLKSVNPEDVGWTGLGKGLSNAFQEIQKFYLDLAHQTMPVVEIGAARPITLVVTKGVMLDIKKLRGGN